MSTEEEKGEVPSPNPNNYTNNFIYFPPLSSSLLNSNIVVEKNENSNDSSELENIPVNKSMIKADAQAMRNLANKCKKK